MNQPESPKPRPWGCIRNRAGKYHVAFTAEGRRQERGPFSSWKAADKMRNRARALIEGGTPLLDVLSSVFGDFTGSTVTFRDAIPLYLAWAATPDKTGKTRK